MASSEDDWVVAWREGTQGREFFCAQVPSGRTGWYLRPGEHCRPVVFRSERDIQVVFHCTPEELAMEEISGQPAWGAVHGRAFACTIDDVMLTNAMYELGEMR